MAQNVVINGVTYSDVPVVEIPKSGGGTAEFVDTSDATLDGGGKMLSGVTAYANGTKYTGSIPTKTGSDMTSSGDTVTAPAGYYASAASKSIAAGTATTPDTAITVTPTISVDEDTGEITASVNGSQSVTPSVSAGYVSSGTAGTISVSGSDTEQMTVQAAQTITPTTSDQTLAKGTFLTGAQTIAGDANLVAGNIKSGVSIFGVAGSLTSAVISQDGVTKVLSIS